MRRGMTRCTIHQADADHERAELESHAPRVVHVDGRNRVIDGATAHLDARLDAELTLTEPA